LPELKVLPASQTLGLGVIPWSPLDGGLLDGSALKPSDDLIGKVKTRGALNAGAAVAYAANRIEPVTADLSGSVVAGTMVTLSTYTVDAVQ